MKHPEISGWTDYVGALTDGGEGAMQSHFDGGCELCRSTLTALERVVETANAAPAPPIAAVRSVKAFFAVQHPQSHGGWRLVKPRIAFDI